VTTDIQNLWSSIRQRVAENPDFELLSPWMEQLQPVVSEDSSLRLRLTDNTLRPYLSRQHLSLLERAASESETEIPTVVIEPAETAASPASTPAETAPPAPSADSSLNPSYVFETLVVGPSNRLARAAAEAVAAQPGRTYNPLFLHGGVGMGKTHMLQAIYHRLRGEHPDLEPVYLTCETFLQQVEAGGPEPQTRRAWQAAEVLLMDNVHFLAGHDTAQEEFFDLFNALYNSHRQIILSSDLSPKSLEGVRESLASRFKWGLIVELEPPTTQMRLAIIERKTEEHNFQLPDAVRTFLAEHVDGNIRELEGAILKLIGYASLLNQTLDVGTAKQVLREYLPPGGGRNLTIKEIQTATCDAFNVSLADMLSKKRARSLVLPRHVAMHLVRMLTNASLEEVGLHFGGRDHSTVKHACEKIHHLLDTDANLHFTITAIKRKLMVTG
jgi:chromosomal replication initiator protein